MVRTRRALETARWAQTCRDKHTSVTPRKFGPLSLSEVGVSLSSGQTASQGSNVSCPVSSCFFFHSR